MIQAVSRALTRLASAISNTYPLGTTLVTKEEPTRAQTVDSSKISYTREEVANLKDKIDLPTFPEQEASDYFVLPGTELFIRGVSRDGFYYTVEGRIIETHPQSGTHRVINSAEIQKDVIHDRFKRSQI